MTGKLGQIAMADRMLTSIIGYRPLSVATAIATAKEAAEADHELFKADYYAKNPKGK